MKSKIEQIRETALLLSPAERASLIHDLILSLDDETAYDLAPEYESEIKRRVDYVKEGKASGEPAKSVFEDIEKKYP